MAPKPPGWLGAPRRSRGAPRFQGGFGAPRWPPNPPGGSERPGGAVALLDFRVETRARDLLVEATGARGRGSRGVLRPVPRHDRQAASLEIAEPDLRRTARGRSTPRLPRPRAALHLPRNTGSRLSTKAFAAS